MVYLIDPRHVLIIPATHQDMVLVWSNESRVIAMSMSMFMLFWWNKNFEYDKDSTLLLIWIRLPHLPFIYFNPVYLQGTCNTIGNFFRADERTFICEYHASKDMYSDGSKPLEPTIWIGESKEFCYPNSISISNQYFPLIKPNELKLDINTNSRNEACLAAHLACWLCLFVLPADDVEIIRPSTFKMACIMASGRRVCRPCFGFNIWWINKILNSSRLSCVSSPFSIHFVYGWLDHYFKTHYPVWQLNMVQRCRCFMKQMAQSTIILRVCANESQGLTCILDLYYSHQE